MNILKFIISYCYILMIDIFTFAVLWILMCSNTSCCTVKNIIFNCNIIAWCFVFLNPIKWQSMSCLVCQVNINCFFHIVLFSSTLFRLSKIAIMYINIFWTINFDIMISILVLKCYSWNINILIMCGNNCNSCNVVHIECYLAFGLECNILCTFIFPYTILFFALTSWTNLPHWSWCLVVCSCFVYFFKYYTILKHYFCIGWHINGIWYIICSLLYCKGSPTCFFHLV